MAFPQMHYSEDHPQLLHFHLVAATHRRKCIYNRLIIMNYLTFISFWVFANIIGFVLGSYFGATSAGLIPGLWPGIAGRILGDLIFGAVIGLFQWLAMRRYTGFRAPAVWILLTSLGFTFGARAGSLLTYRIATEWLAPSLVFGVFMGGSTGGAVLPILWRQLSAGRMCVWLFVSVLAWIIGETIAFSTQFSQATVPHVAVAISIVTGMYLLWLTLRPQPEA